MNKKIVKIILAVVVLGAVSVGALLWSINPILERLKPQLTAKISEIVRAPVDFASVGVRFIPFGIEIKDISIAGRGNGGQSTPDASIGTLILQTSISNLLSGKVTVSEFELRDTSILVTRGPAGISIGSLVLVPSGSAPAPQSGSPQPPPAASGSGGAINGAAAPQTAPVPPRPPAEPSAQAPAAPPPPATAPEPAGEEKAAITFAVESAKIENFDLRFRDQLVSPEAVVAVEDLSASISNLSATESGSIEITGSLLGASPDNLKIQGSAMLPQPGALPRVDLDLSLDAIDLAKVKSLAELYGARLDKLRLGQTASYKIGIKVDNTGITVRPAFDATKAEIVFDELFTKNSGVKFDGAALVRPTLFGAVAAEQAVINLGQIALSLPFSFNPVQGGTFAVKTDSLPVDELAKFLQPARQFSPSGEVKADLSAKVAANPPPGALPELKGKVDLVNISLNVPLKKQPEPAALPVSAVNGSVALNGNAVVIKPLTLQVADQPLSISAEIKDLRRPIAAFEVDSSKLSFDQILSRINPAAAAKAAGSELQAVRLTGDYAADKRSGSLALTAAGGTLAGNPVGKLAAESTFAFDEQMKPLSAAIRNARLEVFGGALTADARLADANRLALSVAAAGMDLAALSKLALADSKLTVSGSMKAFDAKVGTILDNPAKNLRGTASAQLANGEIKGFNLLNETLGKLDQVPGLGAAVVSYVPEKYRPLMQTDTTRFDSLTMKAMIGDETILLESLDIEEKLYRLRGKGRAGFDGSLKIEAQFMLTKVLAEEMALKQPKLELLMDRDRSIVFPVVVQKQAGGVPIVLPDLSRLLSRAAENTAREAGKRALDRVSPGLGQALDSLFK